MSLFFAAFYSFRGLIADFHFSDVFDVAIIAILLYGFFVFFKHSKSLRILFGVGALLGLYIFARLFDLYLTSLALRSFSTVFMIALAIIFQEEIRRFFESLTVWDARRVKSKKIPQFSGVINELVQTVFNLAHKKCGALIVVKGNENIARHIEGGKDLDGMISEEVIMSIFDPTSIGHDGAMIIDKNRIEKFGSHLPLSNNFKQIGKRGTRHSAALGIAERSDALAVIVSEERGEISVAQEGKLKTLKGFNDLEAILTNFFKTKFPIGESWRQDFITRNSFEKILALGAALLMWFFLVFQAEVVQRNFVVPVTFHNLPDGSLIDEVQPVELTVTLAARGQSRFDLLKQDALEVKINAERLATGQNDIEITDDMIKRPPNFSVVSVAPGTAQVIMRRFISFAIPTQPYLKGVAARGFELDKIKINPEVVEVLAPEAATPPEIIFTEPIDINNINKNSRFITHLVLPKNFRLKNQNTIDVTVEIEVRKR